MASLVSPRAAIVALCLFACAVRAQEPKLDAKSKELIAQADAALAKAKSISLVQTKSMVMVRGGKEQSMGGEKTLILASRPGLFRTEKQGDMPEFTVSTGSEWIRYVGAVNAYQKTDVSKHAAAALYRPPAAQTLLLTGRGLGSLWLGGHSLGTLLAGAETCTYAGTETIDGRELHRIDAKLPQYRLSLFLSTGEQVLPVRLSSLRDMAWGEKNTKLRSVLALSDWKLDPPLPKDAFVFTPPEGAKQVDDVAKAIAGQSEERTAVSRKPPPGKPFPAGPDAVTARVHADDIRAWYVPRYQQAYKAHGHCDAKWDEAVMKLHEGWADRLVGDTSMRRLVDLREQLFYIQSLGCHDPVIMYRLANGTHFLEGDAAAEPLLAAAWEAIKDSSYPPSVKNPVLKRYLGVLRKTRKDEKELHAQLRDQLLTLFVQSLAEPSFAAGNQRYFCMLFNSDWTGMRMAEKRLVVERMKKSPGIDPWLRAYYMGRYHIREAWTARGAGYAHTVKKDGWKGFGEHLKLAGEQFVAAWKLHPEFPEAPCQMITVAMGGAADESERLWFDRAIAGQLDWGDAYAKLRWAYRPRWGGTLDWTYAHGVEAANTKRFDSYAPHHFWLSLKDMRGEGESWQEIMARPGAIGTLNAVCEGYLDREPPDPKYPADFWYTIQLIGCWGAGKATEAKRALDSLGTQPDVVVCKDARVDLDQLVAEVQLLAGPHAETAKKGLELLEQEEYDEAVPLLRDLMLALRDTEPKLHAYVGDLVCDVPFVEAPEVAGKILDAIIDMRRREVLVQSFVHWMDADPDAAPEAFQDRVSSYLGPIGWAMMQEAPLSNDLTDEEIDARLTRVAAMALADVPGSETLPAEEAKKLFATEQGLAKLRLHYCRKLKGKRLNSQSWAYCKKHVVPLIRTIPHYGMVLDFMAEHQNTDRHSYDRALQRGVRTWVHAQGVSVWDQKAQPLLSELKRLKAIADPTQRVEEAWRLYWSRGGARFGFQIKQHLDEFGAELDAALMERQLVTYLAGMLARSRDDFTTAALCRSFNNIPGYENRVLGNAAIHASMWHITDVRLAEADAALRVGDLDSALTALIESEKAKADNKSWYFALGDRHRGSDPCTVALIRAISEDTDATPETRGMLEILFPDRMAQVLEEAP